VITANWSSRTFHVTFGYCLVNSVVSAFGVGKPVSKYASIVTGALPHVGAADAVALLVVGVVSEALPPGPPQPVATHAATVTAANAPLRQWARTRPNICISSVDGPRGWNQLLRKRLLNRISRPLVLRRMLGRVKSRRAVQGEVAG
jgi:hypothetical protein